MMRTVVPAVHDRSCGAETLVQTPMCLLDEFARIEAAPDAALLVRTTIA